MIFSREIGPTVYEIKPSYGKVSLNLKELWGYRDLLVYLAIRDISVRYKQALLGFAWIILQPLFTMLVFTVFFGLLGNMHSDGKPYPLFYLCGLVPWLYFSKTLSKISTSIVTHSALITKVYFPRLVIPLAGAIPALVDFVVTLIVLVVLLLIYHIFGIEGFQYNLDHAWRVLLLPVFLGIAIITVLGVGIWLSALNVRFRDIPNILPVLIQSWMFLSPVAYSGNIVPKEYHLIYGINPMVIVIEGFRWALLDIPKSPFRLLLPIALASALVCFISGIWYFLKVERSFADTI